MRARFFLLGLQRHHAGWTRASHCRSLQGAFVSSFYFIFWTLISYSRTSILLPTLIALTRVLLMYASFKIKSPLLCVFLTVDRLLWSCFDDCSSLHIDLVRLLSACYFLQQCSLEWMLWFHFAYILSSFWTQWRRLCSWKSCCSEHSHTYPCVALMWELFSSTYMYLIQHLSIW